MKYEEKYLSLGKFYEHKRDIFLEEIHKSRFKSQKCSATYFQLLDYSSISDLPDMEFSEYLTKEIGVAVIPLSPFYEDRKSRSLVRICFAKSDEVLREAAEKLQML